MTGAPSKWFAVLVFVVSVGIVDGIASAKEFTFRAQQLGGPSGKGEIWLPNSVVIDQKTDLGEPLYFILQNPTGEDHEFAVGGC